MNQTEQQAVLTIAALAAFADGAQGEREREELRRVAESLAVEANLAAVLQDVLLGRATVQAAAAQLTRPEHRQLAYELAAGVCGADGVRVEAETRFLESLATALGLGAAQVAGAQATADALASTPLEPATAPPPPGQAAASDAVLDPMILNYAILNGALELMPQSVASMAIIPLQMKMVYRIGRAHGYELDRGHVKDFLATAGVGLTGQYLEEVGRKLVGGLLGALGGRMLGGLGAGATGMAFSFATTYALGQVAKRYYASGRTMSGPMLKEAFASLLAKAKGMQGGYRSQIEAQARTLDLGRITELVRAR
ncbi:MAG: DUF533 domain-containing protein [Anaeromyxobacteraceae bacterium]|nr:DUF533 domain-containing protein [Anaeromyxobacteraceae bacterium]